MTTYTLGIHSGHNAAVALYKNSTLISAISEERISRDKNHLGFPHLALAQCLDVTGVKASDINGVAISEGDFLWEFMEKPTAGIAWREWYHPTRRKMVNAMKSAFGKETKDKERHILPFHFERLLQRLELPGTYHDYFKADEFNQAFGFANATTKFYPHHMTHAWSGVTLAHWPEALVVTVDGSGFGLSHTTNRFADNVVTELSQTEVAHSPGYFYSDITQLLGFKPLQHEGKITGLAAYGDPHVLREAFTKCCHPSDDKMSFVNDLRTSEARLEYLRSAIEGHSREDVAAAAQLVLEEAIVAHIEYAVEKTGLRKVILAGGVFANVKLNQFVAELPGVEQVFVAPPMGDEGLAIGCAVAMMMEQGTLSDGFSDWPSMYVGPAYSTDECEATLKKAGINYERIDDDAALVDKVTTAMANGKVVGLFRGGMEFGPRALGNRSIVGSPKDPEINKKLNDRLSRTEFMPFAPSVTVDVADELFEGREKAEDCSQYMTITFKAKEGVGEKIPAVIHVDNTARPQVVTRERNAFYYDVIDGFYKKTGMPAILNTSFNTHEEPIVYKPDDAVRAYQEDRIDILVMENVITEAR